MTGKMKAAPVCETEAAEDGGKACENLMSHLNTLAANLSSRIKEDSMIERANP